MTFLKWLPFWGLVLSRMLYQDTPKTERQEDLAQYLQDLNYLKNRLPIPCNFIQRFLVTKLLVMIDREIAFTTNKLRLMGIVESFMMLVTQLGGMYQYGMAFVFAQAADQINNLVNSLNGEVDTHIHIPNN